MYLLASMRPPEFTGGNDPSQRRDQGRAVGFNEAAGIHRRKPAWSGPARRRNRRSFNEAAGIHRRKQFTGSA